MKFVICGGGTAGHVYPGIALAQELTALDPSTRIVFIGSKGGLEEKLVGDAGYEIKLLPISGMPRKRPLALIGFGWKVIRSAFRALSLLRKERPDVVVGMGGFASVAPVLAAPLLGIPVIIHEQNSVPGVVNRWAGRYATLVALSYRPSRRYFKRKSGVEVVGNPLRREILAPVDREAVAEVLGIRADRTTILAFGGSRGAKKLNDAVIAALPKLESKPLQLIHITGTLEYERIKAESDQHKAHVESKASGSVLAYKVFPYYSAIEELYAVSDLIIGRAGASSIAEITSVGKPSVLIPYPHATDDHQTMNADMLAAAGAAEIVKDSELDGDTLAQIIERLTESPELLDRMSQASLEYGKPEAGSILASMASNIALSRSRKALR